MKLAFSTTACPAWDLPTILSHAKVYGYEGVELCAFPGETAKTTVDPLIGDAAALRSAFSEAGLAIACLSCSLGTIGVPKVDTPKATVVRQLIERSAAIGCPLVKLGDTTLGRRNRSTAALALAAWLVPLADYAADHQVSLLIENEFSFQFAQDIWRTLEIANHPALGACWNVCSAAVAGERPAVTVPTLNSRIQYVHVTDARLDPAGPIYVPIGEGDVPVQNFLTRLQGIGYTGWVTVRWDKASLPALAEPEIVLPTAAATLQQYVKVVHRPGHPVKAAAHKPAAV